MPTLVHFLREFAKNENSMPETERTNKHRRNRNDDSQRRILRGNLLIHSNSSRLGNEPARVLYTVIQILQHRTVAYCQSSLAFWKLWIWIPLKDKALLQIVETLLLANQVGSVDFRVGHSIDNHY